MLNVGLLSLLRRGTGFCLVQDNSLHSSVVGSRRAQLW